jgi:AraC-like DNA-binding protein
VHRFVEIAARWTGIVNLGVIVGKGTSAYDLGAFGQLLRRTRTVYDYLQTGAQLIGAVTSGERFWLSYEGELARFHHVQPGRPGFGRCQSDLCAMVVTINMLRRFLGETWEPQQVDLLAPDPAMVGDDAVFGDADLCLNQPHSSFTIPLSALRQAVPAEVSDRGSTQPSIAVLEPEQPSGFLDSVESLIASYLTAGHLDIEVVAEAAGASTRSLQRGLQAFGLSYSAIVDQTRMRVASDWLAGTETPILEVAAMVGYSDPAHFSRAFRRQSGISPRQYRNRNR